MSEYRPTHTVPVGGMQAWEQPDPSHPAVDLGAGLEVQLVERRDAWGRVVASNGWSGWVDGRRLEERSDRPDPASAQSPIADPETIVEPAREAAFVAPLAAPTASPRTAPPVGSPADALPSGPRPGPPTARLPASTPVREARPSHGAPGTSRFGIGRILALAGGVLVILSSWIDWIRKTDASPSLPAYDIPMSFLLDNEVLTEQLTIARGGVGVVALLLGAAIVAGALVRRLGLVSLVAGALAAGLAALFAVQLNSALTDFEESLFDIVGVGVGVCVIGGLIAAVGGVLTLVDPER